MSEAVFIRVHDAKPEHKGAVLRERAAARRNGEQSEQVFAGETADLAVVPGTPFAYWASGAVQEIFRNIPPLEGNTGVARFGLSTKNDQRFLRLWWEVDLGCPSSSTDTAWTGRWVPLAKGGAYAPYYGDVHLVLNWADNGQELKIALSSLYGGQSWSRDIRCPHLYFRPGATWSRRSQKGLSVRALPEGSIFSDKGPAIFPSDRSHLSGLLGIANSRVYAKLAELQMAFGSYEVGVIQRTPVPQRLPEGDPWNVRAAFDQAQAPARSDETTHVFSLPSLVRPAELSLSPSEVASLLASEEQQRMQRLSELQAEIDERVFELYGLPEEERARIRAEVNGTASPALTEDAEPEAEELSAEESEDEDAAVLEDLPTRVANLLMWCLGVAYGRWDVRMARDASLLPELQGPFERLPRVAPGGLVGSDALPATRDSIASEAWLRARPNVISLPESGSFSGPPAISAEQYPIEVVWDGILVDDPGHPRDIIAKVREVLRYVYGARAHAIEEEALSILQGEGGRSPKSLREWFRTQKAAGLGKNFFDFHIQRYSKSRRKAPIYWRLASAPKGSSEYAVWLYYHRLTHDTLWTVLSDFIAPKQKLEESRLRELQEQKEAASGAEKRKLEREIESKQQLLEELAWMERELRAAAEQGYAPDLDDGVVISAAPLHRLIAWKEPEAVWKKLQKGDYDWAKLAMRYWPERVEEKCTEDKSLSIAHGREELYAGK